MDALLQQSEAAFGDWHAQPDRLRTITQRGHTSRITPCPLFGGNLTVLDDDSGQDTEWAARRQSPPATNPPPPPANQVDNIITRSLSAWAYDGDQCDGQRSQVARDAVLVFLATVVALGAVFVFEQRLKSGQGTAPTRNDGPSE